MGKKNVTEIFEVIEWQKELKSISVEDYLSQFKSAFEAYQKSDFKKSISLFSACIESFPNDQAAKALLERCHTLLHDGLPADWDGAYTLTQK